MEGQHQPEPQPEGADDWVRHRWPYALSTVRHARLQLRQALDAARVGGYVRSDAELVLGELVANAVRHGEPAPDGLIEVSWRVGRDRILVGVRDGGHATDLRPGRLGPLQATGRGLALVDLVSSRWCWNDDDGTYVGAELVRG